MQGWTPFVPALIVCVAAATAAAQPDMEQRARARLISEHTILTPGKTNYLGLTFEIQEGWHIYWKGLNDTGYPVKVSLNLPEGYSLGEIQWPAPQRYISAGDILDHVYENSVTLIIPLEVPADASGQARITGRADWLVCSQACIPEEVDLSISVPVAAHVAATSPEAGLFKEARERIPKALPEKDPPVIARLDGDTYEIRSRIGKEIAFFPGEESASLQNPIKDAASKEGVLRLALDSPKPTDRVRGVIELKPAEGGKAQYYTVDFPIADTGSSSSR